MQAIHGKLAAFTTICGVALAIGADSPRQPLGPADKCTAQGACGRFGTAVQFVPTPKEATARARQEQKLVLVLHVSGHFETPEFT
jgi:hypothetical protein